MNSVDRRDKNVCVHLGFWIVVFSLVAFVLVVHGVKSVGIYLVWNGEQVRSIIGIVAPVCMRKAIHEPNQENKT